MTAWSAEARRPDGTWQAIAPPAVRVRDAIGAARRHRHDQGHLAPETRVRQLTDDQLRADYGEPQ